MFAMQPIVFMQSAVRTPLFEGQEDRCFSNEKRKCYCSNQRAGRVQNAPETLGRGGELFPPMNVERQKNIRELLFKGI